MKTPILILSIFIIASFPTAAKAGGLLGSSYNTCVAQLGEPTNHDTSVLSPATDVYVFKQTGWALVIHFWESRASCVIYTKLDDSQLTDSEIRTLQRVYGGGQVWTKAKDFSYSSDQKVVSQQSMTKLTLYTAGFFKEALRQ